MQQAEPIKEQRRESQPMIFLIELETPHEQISNMMELCKQHKADLLHVETRRRRASSGADNTEGGLELLLSTRIDQDQREAFVDSLREVHPTVRTFEDGQQAFKDSIGGISHGVKVPWFPRHISDLDLVAQRVLMYGTHLDADHPGFKDEEYRKRRDMFTQVAFEYRQYDEAGISPSLVTQIIHTDQSVPRIEYTEVEKATWNKVYTGLTELYKTHACQEYLQNLDLLKQYAGYKDDDLPQLEDVSNFLRKRTGFSVRPVAGYLSARDFLAGLAFRVFNATQYIRHWKDPMYTPEPDCCHELLGHMPMMADPIFAQFSQEIGLASLGASDEEVKKLATCYFFTIEFGLCQQNGEIRVYGAGLLSSMAELKHALSPNASVQPFVPEQCCSQECMVTEFQKGYFVTPSFEEALKAMRQFARRINRPFDLTYDPLTQQVRVIDCLDQGLALLSRLKDELDLCKAALAKLQRNTDGSQLIWEMEPMCQ